LEIGIEHKNVEDATWTSLGSFASIESMGVRSLRGRGCRETLRFNVSLSGGTPHDYQAYCIHMLPPDWR
jgi:hypothetical protein